MALTQVAPPYPIFTDTDGSPLDDGYLYIGVINTDPTVLANQIAVYWDSDFTLPAPQPIRTINGYPSRNGTPAQIYCDSQFSITIKNKQDNLVLYSRVGYAINPGAAVGSAVPYNFTGDGSTLAFTLPVTPTTENATNAYVNGAYQNKDTYSLSGAVITFTSPPPNGAAIEIVVTDNAAIGTVNATNVVYTAAGAGAVTTNVQTQLTEQGVYVTRFGADKTGTSDSTSAIIAAWDYAKAVADAEIIVYWPAGTYDVTQLDYTGYTSVRNIALGTVVIIGTDTTGTYDFIAGCDGYDSGNPANSTITRRFDWEGRFIFNAVGGATYTRALKLYAAVSCKHIDIAASGSFTNETVGLQYSYSNEFYGGQYTNSNDGSGGTVYVFKEENNNINNNRYESIRMNGTNDTTDDQVAMRVQGIGEVVTNCDISAIKTGIQYDSARGCSFDTNYFEGCLYPFDCGSASATTAKGIRISGGYMEILTNGVGIKSAGATYGTQGLHIAGVWFKGLSGGSSRTAIDLDAQTYHFTADSCDYQNIDTDITGTYQVGGGIGKLIIGPVEVDASGNADFGANLNASGNLSTDGALSSTQKITAGKDTVTGGFQYLAFDGFSGVGVFLASLNPEGYITASVGSICLRGNGGAGTTLYVKESGTGNTGWVGK